ncbi:MAG: BACON domain-containing protein, partial [bacterium]|nr:BACON domain-containing protein [bacterium]
MRDIFFILLLVLSVATAPVRGEVKEEKPLASTGTTYYVRTDGGSGSQCTGKTDAPYPGTGTNQPCAWSHPFRALDGSGNWKLQGGDTLIIASGSYMMGYGAPNTSGWCDQSYTYGCTLPPLPSGPDANHPTRILGKGWDSNCVNPPELWGTQRPWQIINLGGSSNVYIGCLEITDHSGCVEFHSNPSARCERDTWPYGDWASQGIVAWDASNVTLKHLNIHGLASNGIRAGRISDWTVEDVRIAGNGWAGWDGDLADENDSNSGTLTFDRLTIEWNGCGETYPGKQPHDCWGQTAGGYGDGLGTGATGGHWIFRDSVFRYNTSDGLDLLYARNPGSKIDIKRTQSYGNAGNPIKVNGDAAIENSLLVGNCGFFSGKSFTYNVDHCRALGNSLELSLRKGVTGSVINSTIVGQGDCLVSVGCDDSSCDGTETIILQNNIFMGYDEFLNSWDTTCYIYLDQNNLYTTQIDYNIVYNTKISSVGLFSHDIDQDPLFVNNSLSSFDGHLQSAGPAIDSGLSVGSLNGLVPSGDIEGNTRPAGSGVDRGAYEYGSGGGGSQAQIAMTRTRLYYGASGGSISDAQTVAITNSGSGTLNWTAASGSSWLGISPGSGTDSGIITVSVNASGLSAGTYTGSITVSSANASNSPQTIAVTLEVYGAGQGSSPIGAFDTPLEGTTARSSIPVTGWALDDIRVSSVKIFRGTSESPVYIGDAVFIEGARPDVERAYPGYPSNYKAGWGYMLLTNFLPNSGNGTFTLRAIAEDVEGNSVTLGTRTITCDNANAVKPFGAIDTPTQGGTASGGGFINWGWV